MRHLPILFSLALVGCIGLGEPAPDTTPPPEPKPETVKTEPKDTGTLPDNAPIEDRTADDPSETAGADGGSDDGVAEVDAEPKSRVEERPETRPVVETRVDTPPRVERDPVVETKPETKAQTGRSTERKTETKTEPKPKTEDAALHEAKPKTEPVVTKVESALTKPEPKSKLTLEPKPDPKSKTEEPTANPVDVPYGVVAHAEPLAPLVDDYAQPTTVNPDCTPTDLQGAAAKGRLGADQIACLEASYATASRTLDREGISLTLLANARAKGDTKSWNRLAKRHLSEIDHANADVAHTYALHRMKDGDAGSALRWSEVALDNRAQWSGAAYFDNVWSAYRVRAAAAQALWRQAEDARAKEPTEANAELASQRRVATQKAAVEWLSFARETQRDTAMALRLCEMASPIGECVE